VKRSLSKVYTCQDKAPQGVALQAWAPSVKHSSLQGPLISKMSIQCSSTTYVSSPHTTPSNATSTQASSSQAFILPMDVVVPTLLGISTFPPSAQHFYSKVGPTPMQATILLITRPLTLQDKHPMLLHNICISSPHKSPSNAPSTQASSPGMPSGPNTPRCKQLPS
jgi:hypothetical protein